MRRVELGELRVGDVICRSIGPADLIHHTSIVVIVGTTLDDSYCSEIAIGATRSVQRTLAEAGYTENDLYVIESGNNADIGDMRYRGCALGVRSWTYQLISPYPISDTIGNCQTYVNHICRRCVIDEAAKWRGEK